MKASIFISLFFGSCAMLYAQQPVVPSHYNDTESEKKYEFVTFTNNDSDEYIDEPDFFKIDCFNTTHFPVFQDSIVLMRRNSKPFVGTNNR